MEFTAKNTSIYYGNEKVKIKGVNWFGIETDVFAFHGLWSVSMKSILDFLQKNNFNAIRVPFSTEVALGLDTIKCKTIDTQANPNMIDWTVGKLLDFFVAECKKRGILVMFDMHRFVGTGNITELWYDEKNTEAVVIDAWKNIVTRYANDVNVFAYDLKNEPHGQATWGEGSSATDWASAAERIGNAILKLNPRTLIFVEGVEKYKGNGSWWGGNFQGVKARPIKLNVPNKLVYSPHVYGPSVSPQEYFNHSTYPTNLQSIWDKDFGYVKKENLGTIVIGEWGGWMKTENKDDVWQQTVGKYFKERDIDYFYWCLNPNSGDTGGLLGENWTTPVVAKLNLLNSVSPNPTKFKFNAALVVPVAPVVPVTPLAPVTPIVPVTPVVPVVVPTLPSTKLSMTVRKVKDWVNNNIPYAQYEIDIKNTTQSNIVNFQVQIDCDVISQYWSSTLTNKIFSFPNWITSDGGLKAGQTFTFGFIVSGKVPILTLLS